MSQAVWANVPAKVPARHMVHDVDRGTALTKPRGHASHGRCGILELYPAGHTTGAGVPGGQYSPFTHGRTYVAFNGQKYVAGHVLHVQFEPVVR
jgi:hypothetical protein